MSEQNDTFEEELREERVQNSGGAIRVLTRLMSYAKPYWARVAVGFILVCVASGLAVFPPMLVGALVDSVFGNGDSLPSHIAGGLIEFIGGAEHFASLEPATQLTWFAFMFLGVRILLFIVDYSNGYLLSQLGQRVLLDIRQELFAHIHRLSLAFFHRNPVGRLVTRVSNDVGALEDVFSTSLVTILKDVAMLVGIAAALLFMNVRLGLIALIVMPLMLIAATIFRRYSRKAYARARIALSRLNSFMAENLSGIRVVQLFHKEERNEQAFNAIASDYRKYSLQQRYAWAVFRPVSSTLSATGMGLVIGFGGAAVLGENHLLSVGMLVSFFNYTELFFMPIRDLTEKLDSLQSAMTSAERIFTILDERPTLQDAADARDCPTLSGHVEFKHVGFSYKVGEPVLSDVNFSIPAGKTVAIVGPTGAGKSTIINLINRLYDVSDGQVLVDGQDVRSFKMQQLRRQIAVVHQDVFLFAGTVQDNIRLGDASITDEQVRAACEAVGADKFIQRLPGGYSAMVSEAGKTFSAGERQLLSFARALVFNPAILVLDEATSSVDSHTEAVIQQALLRLTHDRTSIIIAHRLSTIQRADCIFVMHHGRLAESGTHQELLAQGGMYYRLYLLQYGGEMKAS